jgi:2-polyprenyl-3-methyl-5-hydroxy-6-metoxy-1,4-benzoquinol methylase
MKYDLVPNLEFGFLQVRPTPSEEEITAFYSAEFYSGDYKKFNDSALEVQLEDADFYHGTWGQMAANIERLRLRPLAGTSLLDVGCGWAQALLFLRGLGMDCYGFDPAPEAVEYATRKGLNVRHAGMGQMAVFENRRFDVVTLMNVLEHLADPVSILREIRSDVLKPGGMIVIDVPNEFNVFQTAGRDLHGLSDWWVAPPGHLNYFNRETLTNLLEGTGYEVRYAEASFPLEIFLLFGDNYVGNSAVGKACHRQRVNFEVNLRRLGRSEELRKFYATLAGVGLGRQVTIYAEAR